MSVPCRREVPHIPLRSRAAGALPAASVLQTSRTWFDHSPSPRKHSFDFPSNRSSASTAPRDRSASPADRPGGALEAMRSEAVQLMQRNRELRARLAEVEAAAAEGARWRSRCAQLDVALRAAREEAAAKEAEIAMLREQVGRSKEKEPDSNSVNAPRVTRRTFTPQTLADLAALPYKGAKPWFDENEVRYTVQASRESRRCAETPQQSRSRLATLQF